MNNCSRELAQTAPYVWRQNQYRNSVQVSDGYAHDYTYFKGLVDKTAKSGFTMKEVSADKGPSRCF